MSPWRAVPVTFACVLRRGDLFTHCRALRSTALCAVSYDLALALIVWDVAPDLRLKISLYKDDGCISLCTPPNSQKFRHSNALFSMLRQKIYRHIPSLFSHDITHWHPAADEIWNEIQKINAGEMQFAIVRTPFSYCAIHIGASRNFSFHRIIYLGEFLK